MKWRTTRNLYMNLLFLGIILMVIGFLIAVIGAIGLVSYIQKVTYSDISTMYSTIMGYVGLIEIAAILSLVGSFIVPIMTYLLFGLVFGGLKEIKKALRESKAVSVSVEPGNTGTVLKSQDEMNL